MKKAAPRFGGETDSEDHIRRVPIDTKFAQKTLHFHRHSKKMTILVHFRGTVTYTFSLPPRVIMNKQVYQVAFAEASSELSEIVEQLQQLSTRKELIERVVEALKPVVALAEDIAAKAQQDADSSHVVSQRNFENRLDQAIGTGEIIQDPAFPRQNSVCFETGRW